jgi:class 3 adenylate cyclase
LCGSCGTELPPDSRFCNKCGAPITPAAAAAEYKQVTVLFADVVHSMDIAAAVGAERLRVGLNSGQVIAGEIGSSALRYTAIGEQVGLAQRMESVAPPGGVMLSASTARLVERVAALGELELVRIKGADEPVPARRLLGMSQGRPVSRAESNLVGRRWEMSAVEGLLDRAVGGDGAVVGVVHQILGGRILRHPVARSIATSQRHM